MSANAAGTDSGSGASKEPRLSGNGHFAFFFSTANDIAAPDTNGNADFFARDLEDGTSILLSPNAAGSDGGNGTSGRDFSVYGPRVGADGSVVAFSSEATDLRTSDANGPLADIYVAQLEGEHDHGLLLGAAAPALVGGILLDGADVVRFSAQQAPYELVLRGAAAGLPPGSVDALDVLPDGDLLLSFSQLTAVPGVGDVESGDVVRFTPASTGEQSAGSFNLFFDASAIGISGPDANVDAIAYADGVLALSPGGSLLPGELAVQREDVVALDLASGATELVFDGSAFGLQSSDLDALEVLADGDLLLSFGDAVTLPGVGSVSDEDVVRFEADASNPASAGSFRLEFAGSQNGWTGADDDVDAVALD